MDTWERSAPPIHDEPTLIPKSEAELSAISKIQPPDLTEAKAPPLAAQTFEPANENSESPDKTALPPKRIVSSTTPEGEASLAVASGLKTVSSFRLRTIAIVGMLSFVAGVTLAVVLFSKSGWSLPDRRSAYESNAASVPNPARAQTTTMTASATDSSLSDTPNQLRFIGTELNSLRKDLGSLAGEVAQIRKAQEELITAQAQLARNHNGLVPALRADNVARAKDEPLRKGEVRYRRTRGTPR
jgi:hypothetical protein